MLYRRAYMSRSRLVERPPEEGSRKWLIAELDRYTSLIVRRRDGRCVTCGNVRGLQCSHFYSRRYLSIRFDPLGAEAKAVREALLRLGMQRCSLRLVHYQAEPRPLRLDWYGLYWRWLRALHLAHPAGADFLFEDLRARYSALRERGELAAADWYEQLAECEREHSEAIRAAILDRDPRLIRKEIAEAISALRRQLALLDAREGRESRNVVGMI